jgi:primary-amine oxidase
MHRIAFVVAAAGLLILWCQPAAAQVEKPSDCPQSLVISFPTSGTPQTQWDLCYEVVERHGLVVRSGSFRTSPLAPHVKVLSDARVAEIFVPYHSGVPRLYEVSGASHTLRPLGPNDCPASTGGTLLAGNLVCRQVRDRRVAWHIKAKVRRGQEVVLWGVLQAGHSDYIIEWVFRDDGVVRGQVGKTGPALSSVGEGHTHNVTWRLDIDLNGADGDTVRRTRHLESVQSPTNPGTSATDEKVPVAAETSLDWIATEFTTVEVGDVTLQNANGRQTSYELFPLRSGTARHSEAFTQADVWLTRYAAAEMVAADLPSYVSGESIDGQDVVLWYTGSVHCDDGARDEELDTVPVKWVGFTLEPKNLFSSTPLYP